MLIIKLNISDWLYNTKNITSITSWRIINLFCNIVQIRISVKIKHYSVWMSAKIVDTGQIVECLLRCATPSIQFTGLSQTDHGGVYHHFSLYSRGRRSSLSSSIHKEQSETNQGYFRFFLKKEKEMKDENRNRSSRLVTQMIL